MTEPENEPSCDDGMAMDPDVTPGGPLDPRRTCGASVRDTVHAAHAPSAYDRTAAGKARAAVSKPPEPPEPLDLQDPVTNIRVYRTGSWWKPWRAEITFRGMDLTTIRGWDEDTVETRAYAAVERAHRAAEKRRRTYRSIDVEGV